MPRAARWLFRSIGPASVLAVAGLLAQGRLRGVADPRWDEVAAAAGLVAGLCVAGVRRALRAPTAPRPRVRDDLELGAPLVAAAYMLVALAGAGVHPLVYVVMAGLVGFFEAVPASLLVALALGFEALLTLRSGWIAFATHAAFLALFAVIYRVVLNARLALARRAEEEAVKARIKEVEERARTYRLASAGSSEPAPDAGSQWMLAAVKQVEGAVGSVLEIGELALRTHTCAAFLLAPDDRTLLLHDCRSASERVQRGAVHAGEGILAGVLKRSVPVRMVSPSGLRGVTWYDGGPAPRSVCAVPLVEAGGQLRGVLLADRMEPQPFEDGEETLLRTLAGEVLRAIEVERVLVEIRRARDEKGRFFKAIEDLNRAANLDAVFGAVLDGARQLAGLDFAAITLVSEHEGKRQHRVARMSGASPAGKTLEGRVFGDNNGLVRQRRPLRDGPPGTRPARDGPAGGLRRRHPGPRPRRAEDPAPGGGGADPRHAGRGRPPQGLAGRGRAADAGGHRPPGRAGGAPGAAVRPDRAAGHDRRPHRAAEPPRVPVARRRGPGAGAAVRNARARCSSRTWTTSSR
jgi:hypothetical protein